MNLSSYLAHAKLTRADFAAQVGAHPVTVSRWATGAALPKRQQMARIEEITGGQVTARDMLETAMSVERRAAGEVA